MPIKGQSEGSESSSELEWAFEHWYRKHSNEDTAFPRKLLLASISASIIAILLNSGTVEIAQSDISGVVLTPISKIAIGALFTGTSVGATLSMMPFLFDYKKDEISLGYFADQGVGRAVELKKYRRWEIDNMEYNQVEQVASKILGGVFLLGPLASIITFVLSVWGLF
jgi:hypothetical protein